MPKRKITKKSEIKPFTEEMRRAVINLDDCSSFLNMAVAIATEGRFVSNSWADHFKYLNIGFNLAVEAAGRTIWRFAFDYDDNDDEDNLFYFFIETEEFVRWMTVAGVMAA